MITPRERGNLHAILDRYCDLVNKAEGEGIEYNFEIFEHCKSIDIAKYVDDECTEIAHGSFATEALDFLDNEICGLNLPKKEDVYK